MADRNYRANLRGALAYGAAGLMAGALIVTTTGPFAWWLIAGIAVTLLVLAVTGITAEHAPTQVKQDSAGQGELPSSVRELMETIPDPLLLADAAGRVVYTNGPMHEFAGTDASGKPIAAVMRIPAV